MLPRTLMLLRRRLRPPPVVGPLLRRRDQRSLHAVAAAGFAVGADAYERTRPSYPPEALQLVFGVIERASSSESSAHTGPLPVLDLAAGTGKFTRLLAAHPRLQVVAVEPVAAMRRVFAQVLPPTVGVVEGSASRIPFADEHFAAVCCAQVRASTSIHLFHVRCFFWRCFIGILIEDNGLSAI